ncbi:MAG: T9SS type A sorting domain-containing protein [Bacteroidia bacterium]|nr:T9SS type A sorting domain-containing protein [Bacteroidia bacterium]MCO5253581.1 T9SS type A sorting domain-containing protein [Bacteroidota bacterium]
MVYISYKRYAQLILLVILLLFGTSLVKAQCVLPTYDVVIGTPTTGVSWTPSGSGVTGGTRQRVVQIHSSPDVFMRITWVARSSSSVTLSNWDQTPAGPLDKTRGYNEPWQPMVRFPSSSSATDTAWAEFFVEFASKNGSGSNSFDNNLDTLACLPVTVVDLDGSGSSTGNNAFQEINYVSAPSMPFGIPGSTISSGIIGSWVVNVSDFPVFNNIDTINKVAMVQMNFSNVQYFYMRAGVIGKRRNNPTERQYSFWLRPFDSLTVYLPVHYESQTLTGTETQIIYDWVTASEQNNNYFDVEKSTDGVFWQKIGKVDGCGSCESAAYRFIDESPFNGYNLYRLKQVDMDNKFQYSPIVKYYWSGNEMGVSISPNPTSDRFDIAGVHEPNIKIFSALGNLVLEQYKTQSVDMTDLPPGVYFVEITHGIGEGKSTIHRVIKQ